MKVIKERGQPKPFLKWAGGKTQLLNVLATKLPESILSHLYIERYVEPFVGSGAMFFFLKRHFKVNESYLIDSNPELILAFRVVQKDPETLIQALQDLEKTYFCLSEKKRSEFFLPYSKSVQCPEVSFRLPSVQ